MKISVVSTVLIFLLVQTLSICATPSSEQAEIARGSYNHLAINYGLLRSGIDPEVLRVSLYEQLNLDAIDKPGRAIYKDYTVLLNKHGELFNEQSSSKTATKGSSADLSQMLKLGTALYTGGSSAIFPAVLSLLRTNDGNVRTLNQEVSGKLKQKWEQIDSDFVFKLIRWRSSIINQYHLDPNDFIEPSIIKQETTLRKASLSIDTLKSKLTSLYNQNSAYYPLGLEVANFYISKNEVNKAKDVYLKVVNASPSILYRDPIRTQALARLTEIAAKGEDIKTAERLVKRLDKESPHSFYSGFAKMNLAALKEDGSSFLDAIEIMKQAEPDYAGIYVLESLIRLKRLKDIDGAAKALKTAIDKGFTGIDLAFNGQLIELKKHPLIANQKTLRFNYRFRFRLLAADEMAITNVSNEKWTNLLVSTSFTHIGVNGLQREYPTFNYAELNPGSRVIIKVGKTTKKGLDKIFLEMKATQGNVKAVFQNNNGKIEYIGKE